MATSDHFRGRLRAGSLAADNEHHWTTRRQLALAIFEWIECWYNPSRRHSFIQMLSPVDYETRYTPAATAA